MVREECTRIMSVMFARPLSRKQSIKIVTAMEHWFARKGKKEDRIQSLKQKHSYELFFVFLRIFVPAIASMRALDTNPS